MLQILQIWTSGVYLQIGSVCEQPPFMIYEIVHHHMKLFLVQVLVTRKRTDVFSQSWHFLRAHAYCSAISLSYRWPRMNILFCLLSRKATIMFSHSSLSSIFWIFLLYNYSQPPGYSREAIFCERDLNTKSALRAHTLQRKWNQESSFAWLSTTTS